MRACPTYQRNPVSDASRARRAPRASPDGVLASIVWHTVEFSRSGRASIRTCSVRRRGNRSNLALALVRVKHRCSEALEWSGAGGLPCPALVLAPMGPVRLGSFRRDRPPCRCPFLPGRASRTVRVGPRSVKSGGGASVVGPQIAPRPAMTPRTAPVRCVAARRRSVRARAAPASLRPPRRPPACGARGAGGPTVRPGGPTPRPAVPGR